MFASKSGWPTRPRRSQSTKCVIAGLDMPREYRVVRSGLRPEFVRITAGQPTLKLPRVRPILLLALLVLGLAATGLTLGSATLQMGDFWHGVGGNMFADAIAIGLGATVIDQLVKGREAERLKPTLRAAWRSAWRVQDRMAGFIEMGVEGCFAMPYAADLKAAIEDQDRRFFARMLQDLVFDPDQPEDNKARIGEGRMAVQAYLEKALAEAGRFMERFVGVAPPELVGLIEKFETSQVAESSTRRGIRLGRIHRTLWADFLQIEHELKAMVIAAQGEFELNPPWDMRRVGAGAERWLKPSPGWTDAARRRVEVMRTPRSELPTLRDDPDLQ